MGDDFRAIYWDTSAILSALFKDSHSDVAQKWVHEKGIHLISTLAYAETCAVIARMRREGVFADILAQASFEILDEGPWRRLAALPEWIIVQSLSAKWRLRGADLWHLATAKSIQKELPELFLLTFDARLQKAAEGEGLVSTIK